MMESKGVSINNDQKVNAVKIEGYLFVRIHMRRRRYCVLNGRILCLFASKEEAVNSKDKLNARKTYSVVGVKDMDELERETIETLVGSGSYQNALIISMVKSKVLVIEAETKTEKQRWLHAMMSLNFCSDEVERSLIRGCVNQADFNGHMAVTLLYKYRDNATATDLIVDRLAQYARENIDDVEFYIQQIVHLLVHAEDTSTHHKEKLVHLLLSICKGRHYVSHLGNSIHLALQLFWLLESLIHDCKGTPSYNLVAMLLMSIEAKVVNQHLDLKDAMTYFQAVPDLRAAVFHGNEKNKSDLSAPEPAPPSPWTMNEKEKQILLQWMESERLLRYKDFHDQMNFIKALTDISEKMRHFEPREGRKQALPQLLSTLVIPPRAFIPLGRASDPFCRVIRVLPTEGTVFSTHSRAPCLICFEVIEDSTPQHPLPPPPQNTATTSTANTNHHQHQQHYHHTQHHQCRDPIETSDNEMCHPESLSPLSSSSFTSQPYPPQAPLSVSGSQVDSPTTRKKWRIAQQYKSMSSSSGALMDEEEAQIRKVIQHAFRQEFCNNCDDATSNSGSSLDGKSDNDNHSDILNVGIITVTNQSPSASSSSMHVTTSTNGVSHYHPIYLKQQLNMMIDTTTSNIMNTDIAASTAISLHSTLMRRSSKTAYETGLAKIMLLDTNVFGESWEEKKKRIQASSPDGQVKGWNLISLISKSNDDMRQEVFALQLISKFRDIFHHAQLPLWLRAYRIVSTGHSTGLIETITDAQSLDALKKRKGYKTLRAHFEQTYGRDHKAFKTAQRNFLHSLVAYALVSYFLQVKDRHNGNILLDTQGHLIHIDFGFLLGIAPGGNWSLESQPPFKLTKEMVEVLGGVRSPIFIHFIELFTKGFLALQRHAEEIITLVEIMMHKSSFPCFANRDGVKELQRLRERFAEHLTLEQTAKHATKLVKLSYKNKWTKRYDKFQKMTNGILP